MTVYIFKLKTLDVTITVVFTDDVVVVVQAKYLQNGEYSKHKKSSYEYHIQYDDKLLRICCGFG